MEAFNNTCGLDYFLIPGGILFLFFAFIQVPLCIFLYRKIPKKIWEEHRRYCLENKHAKMIFHENLYLPPFFVFPLVGEITHVYVSKQLRFKRAKKFEWWDLSSLPRSAVKLIWVTFPFYVAAVVILLPMAIFFSSCKLYYHFF